MRASSYVVLLASTVVSCTPRLAVEVKPSDCLNPPTGDCSGGSESSRIIEVRLYQLSRAVNPCMLDHNLFLEGKDAEALKGALVESQRSDAVRWSFKVPPGEPRVVGNWEIQRGTTHILAVTIGRGRGPRSIRVIPYDVAINGKLPTLYLRGYDVCLGEPCETSMEAQCR